MGLRNVMDKARKNIANKRNFYNQLLLDSPQEIEKNPGLRNRMQLYRKMYADYRNHNN
jgi:hypothetical protein